MNQDPSLPPGCSVNDIPGNTPEDMEWEEFNEQIDRDSTKHGLSIEDCRLVWQCGLATWPIIQKALTEEHKRGKRFGEHRILEVVREEVE